jgi:hypothetical protein
MKQATYNKNQSIFQAPYSAWRPAQILAYYQERSHVCYFPILDEEETRREKMDSILGNRFEFNGEQYTLPECFDWTDNPSPDKEWRILLHKFYYAVGLGALYHQSGDRRYAAKWLELTNAWIDTVPFDFLPSDVIGRRVQNWIFAHYYFVTLTRTPLLLPDFYLKFLTSLYDQVHYLCQNLTPARNHRTIELCAIFLTAVVFPEFKEARQWLDFARQELLHNMQTDLLADGVQYELSTDYHHVVLKNYLGIRQLACHNHIPMPAAMDDLLRRALEFAMYAHKPDGWVPSLSDGDVGSFLSLLQQGSELYGSEELLYVATRGRQGQPPAQRSRAFTKSGYIVLRSGWGDGPEPYTDERYLIFDCGPLGVGNHGHLDLLSFEMAAYGRSLIVDPGRYTYDESGDMNWRALFRGTGYHNTVQVDKKNQTRYAFHKTRFKIQGPEPERELKAFITAPGYDYIHGIARSHEYPVVHERKLFFPWLEYWILSDFLPAAETHHYDLLFHLSPEAWQQVIVETAGNTCLVQAPHLVIAQPAEAQIQPFVEPGYVSPTYGVKHTAPIVRFACQAAGATYHTVLYPYGQEKPRLAVAVLPVLANGRLCPPTEAFALSITIIRDGERYTDIYFNGTSENPGCSYCFANYTYDGLLLCLRQDGSGHIVNIQGQPGTVLYTDGHTIPVE